MTTLENKQSRQIKRKYDLKIIGKKDLILENGQNPYCMTFVPKGIPNTTRHRKGRIEGQNYCIIC